MTLVFDTEPLLAYLQHEPAGARVGRLLRAIELGRERGAASRVTLAELGYVLARRHLPTARSILDRLPEAGLEPLPCDPFWRDAGELKARFGALSLADAFAAASARGVGGTLVLLGDEPLKQACRAEGIRFREP